MTSDVGVHRLSRVHARCRALRPATGAAPEPPLDPETTRLESAGWTLDLTLDGPASVGHDPEGHVSVVLHGELHEARPVTAGDLAARFALRGEAMVDDLNGSYALIILDRRRDRLLAVMDRVGSRRLFWSRDPEGHTLTTDLLAQPIERFALDPVGVGWVLATSACLNDRTPFDGIRILTRGQVHTLESDGLSSRTYWSYAIREPATPVDEEVLVEGLRERLVAAVRRRVEGDDDLFLSLSGGTDCRAIALVLARELGRTDVQAWSYRLGPMREGGDARVATRLAEALGIPHQVVESYHGDLLAQMALQARVGEGIVPDPASGIWAQLSPRFGAARRPTLFVGDEYFGGPPTHRTTREELLYGLRFRGIRVPGPAGRALPHTLVRTMTEGLEGDIADIFGRQPDTPDSRAFYNYFNHEQRDTHVILPWRERYAGRFATVRNPWFDSDLLDFVTALPMEQRNGKVLFNRTVEAMAPDLATIPAATHEGYHPNYRAEAQAHAGALEDWARGASSRLDELIPPAFGLALIREHAREHPIRRFGRRIRRGVARRLGHAPPAYEQVLAPHTALRRWAILRMALERGGPAASL